MGTSAEYSQVRQDNTREEKREIELKRRSVEYKVVAKREFVARREACLTNERLFGYDICNHLVAHKDNR
jgi:hypothetical protein